MAIEIRTVREDELPAYVDALSTAFLERPDVHAVVEELRPHWDLTRIRVAVEGGRVVGTFRSWPSELTVPGRARLPAAAIAAVTVLPTHRRRGILRSLAAAEHAAVRERGEAVAILHASEYAIYGRFGYGPACREASWTLDAARAGFHTGSTAAVELVPPDADAKAALVSVFEAWRRRQPGEIRRRDYGWDYDLGRPTAWGQTWKGFVALHRDSSGEVDGYARYHTEEKWQERQPRAVVHVDDLHALSDEAYASLWRFLAEIDLVETVRAEYRRSPSERLPWLLTNGRAAMVSEIGDGLWVRLLDVERALAARTYEREARLVLEIVDEEAPGGRIRVELDAGPAGASCSATTRSPDLTLHASALGAAYLGGAPLRHAVLATGADEHRAGALAEADACFRMLDEPWCSTHF